MNPIRFICGRPGSGKTTLCLSEIEASSASGNPAFLLVPEQFSLQAEKLLLKTRRASVNARALSFNRLAYWIFARLGGPKGKLLDEAGRNMLLRKVIFECGDELVYYRNTADKPGFIDKLARAVSEFNRYRVTSGDLRLRAPESEEALAGKLTDLALILERYRSAVEGNYLPADDMLELLCKRLEGKDVLRGSYFWADGFYGFTPQEIGVLKHIIKNAEQVTFAFTAVKDDPLFADARETIEQIRAIAKELNVPALPETVLNENRRHINSPGLHAITGNFSLGRTTAAEDCGGVEIISARDGYASAYEAARICLSLVREKKYRFRDIAVLCGEDVRLPKILQTVFDRYLIPIFADMPAGVLSHPLTELIRSALEIIVKGWQYEGVMRFLKTRLTSLTRDEVDRLENYILARGITGYKWKYPFSDELEDARLRVLSCMAAFEKTRADTTATVKDFCVLLTDMLYALDVPQKLSDLHSSRMDANDTDVARLHRQIWPKICDTLDKLVEILGEERVSLRVFAKLLDAGLAGADLGRIPPAIDQVFVGDAGRTRFPEIKAMIVIGANDGRLPAPAVTEELLSDFEREQLENTALALAPAANRQMTGNWYSLYSAICQPSENLYIIYSESESGGKPLRPSPLIGRLQKLFPTMKTNLKYSNERSSSIRDGYMMTNDCARSALSETSYNRPGCIHDTRSALSEESYNPADHLNSTRSALSETSYNPPGCIHDTRSNFILSPASSSRLYGSVVVTAASRLEKFASCPFAYYAAYNLKARERKIYEVHPADLGVLYHAVLEAFAKTLETSGREWGSLSKAEISAYVDEFAEAHSSDPNNVLQNTTGNRSIMRKVKRICVTSIWALCEHVKCGSYKPSASEVDFAAPGSSVPGDAAAVLEVRLDNNRKLLLTGRIDRVDLLHTENADFVKIIDYKSGRVKFDLTEVMSGTQLQLILYMTALLKLSPEELKPGGVFYFHLDDPVLNCDGELDDKRREELLLECFKMSGLVVAEPESVAGMDSGLAITGRSRIIPVSVNKDGGYSKSSSVAEPDYFKILGKMVEDKIKELGLKMTEGVITPEPLKKRNSIACDYCKYDVICGHTERDR